MEESKEMKLDILNREDFINNTIQLIKIISANKGNITFAVNGEWGCGKTFVLGEIQRRLNLDNEFDYIVIPYNCWQYDYYEEPLVAIISTLLDYLDKSRKIPDEKKKKIVDVVKKVGKAFLAVGTHYVEYRTGLDFGKEADTIKDFIDGIEIDGRVYDTNFGLRDTLEKLKEELTNLAKEKTIVFCVDELDRCLPEYSIKVLERLHHIAESVPNVITIIAVDESRLKHAVDSIFGPGSAANYLKKFIRFEVLLDKGRQDSSKFFKKFSEFYERFDADAYGELNNTDQFLEELFINIDMRTREQIVDKAAIINDICFGKARQDRTIMHMELFYTTLYYVHGVTSIFNEEKIVYSKDKKPFTQYKDCNEILFTSSSGFYFPNNRCYTISTNAQGIPIDLSNIFMLAFYYWYNTPVHQDLDSLSDVYAYPYIESCDSNYNKIQMNLEKLKVFLETMRNFR